MAVGRNELCPCGTGKKYKNCCLNLKQEEASRQQNEEEENYIIELNPIVEKEGDKLCTFIEQGNLPAAKKIALQLFKKFPNNHQVHFFMALCHLGEENISEAIEHLENAVAIFPLFSEAYFNLGMIYRQLVEIPECVACFRKIIKIEKGSSLARQAEKELKSLERIVGDLDQYIHCQEIFDQAFDYLNSQEFEKAIQLFQKVLSIKSNHVQCYGNIGIAYGGLGKQKLALEYLDKALAIDPNYGPAIINRQNVLEMKEREKLSFSMSNINYYEEMHKMKHGNKMLGNITFTSSFD